MCEILHRIYEVDSTDLRFACEILRFVESGVESRVDSAILHFACEILRFCTLRVRFCGIVESGVDSAIAYNRSNGGVAFVFVKNFGCEARLMVCGAPKFFASAKSHTPEQIANNKNLQRKDFRFKRGKRGSILEIKLGFCETSDEDRT